MLNNAFDMKKYNNIDELFKDELQDHKVNPEKDLWPEMEKAMFKPKPSKWKYIIPLLLISIAIFYFSNNFIEVKDQSSPDSKLSTLSPDISANDKDEIITEFDISKDSSNNVSDTKTGDYNSVKVEDIATVVNQDNSDNGLTRNVEVITEESMNINKYYQQKTINERKHGYIDLNNDHLINSLNVEITIPQLYNNKRKLTIYSFITASAGMAYYSNSTDKFTWSVDMGAGYKVGRLYFETGIGYQQMKENGYYRIDYSSEDSVGYYNKVVSFELDQENPEQILYNIKQTTVYDSVDHYTHSSPIYTYNYINIPITIGYRFYNSEKFNISIQGGIILSILNNTHRPDISYNNPETKLIGITNLTSQRASNNLRMHIGLRVNTTLFRGVSLSVQPEFTKWLNSIYTSDHDKALPYTMSIKAGIYYNF